MKKEVKDLFNSKVSFMVFLLLVFGAISVFAGNIIVNENGIQSDNYYASDGSPGITQNITYKDGEGNNQLMMIVNGLIINASGGTSSGEESNQSSGTWWDSGYQYCRTLFPSSSDARTNEVITTNIILGSSWAYIAFLYSGTGQDYSVYYNNLSDIHIVDKACNDEGNEIHFELIDSSEIVTTGTEIFDWYDFGYEKSSGELLTTGGWEVLEGNTNHMTYDNSNVIRGDVSLQIDSSATEYNSVYHSITSGHPVLSFYFYDEGTTEVLNYPYHMAGFYTNGNQLVQLGYRTTTSTTNYVARDANTYYNSSLLRNTSWHVGKLVDNGTDTLYYIDGNFIHTSDLKTMDEVRYISYLLLGQMDSFFVTTGQDINQYIDLTEFNLGPEESQ